MFYYYTQDGSKFDSKVEALEYGLKTGTPVYFYYYDDLYSKLNWKVEPIQSLDYYYLEQAKRIRDQYDYVILCYSGGYDSSNILETFYYNNIKLDKIVTVGAFEQDTHKFSDENHNGEVYYNVLPYISELGLNDILQVLDYSKLFNNTRDFSILNHNESWVDLCGGWFSPHNWFWYDIEKYVVPEHFRNKRVCIIFGKDKPSLFSLGDSMLSGFQFRDTPVNSYASTLQRRNEGGNIHRLDFYWDPTYPEILLKQLHVLRKYYTLTKYVKHDELESVPIIGDKNVNSLIYNLRKPILFKSSKSKTFKLSLRDQFLKYKQNSDIADKHNFGLQELNSRLLQSDPKPIFSKFYSII